LHLEDEPDFAELVRSLLEQGGVDAEVRCVGDRPAFALALENGTYDLIISDYHLPSFNGLEAMALAKKKFPHTPFILVSGTIGEQAAIESLRAGATDYVLKQQPDRLPSAVRRAVREAQEHARLRQTEMELSRREKYFRALTENALDILTVLDREGVVVYKSGSVKAVLGYDPEEMIGKSVFDHVHPDDLSQVRARFQSALNEPARPAAFRFRYRHKNGEWRHLEAIGQNRLADPEINALIVNSRDVTDRWRAEEELRQSEKQYRLLFQSNPNPMWVFDLETLKFLEVNEAAVQHYGYTREEFLGMTVEDIRAPEKNGAVKTMDLATDDEHLIWRQRLKNGNFIDARVLWSPLAFRGRLAALTMATDVTERRRVEHRNMVFSRLSHRLSSVTTAAAAAKIISEAADALFKWDDFALDLYFAESDEVFSLLNITTVEGQRVEIPSSVQPKTANALIRRVVNRGAELLSSIEAQDHRAATMLAPILKGAQVIGVLFIQNRSPGSYTHGDLGVLQTLADQCSGALERVRTREQLLKSEQRFRDLFENSPDAIFVEDFHGEILDVNQAGCLLCGLTRAQLVGKNAVDDLLPADLRDNGRQIFQQLVAGKLSWVEGEHVAADGRVIPVEVRAGRVDYNGQPALLLHVRDITQRRAAETALQSSEMLFRSVWENSVDGMRLTDENGTIVAVNGAFCKLVGLESAALIGQPFTIIYAASENPFGMIQSHHDQFLHRAAHEKIERQRVLHNGQTVMLEIMFSFVEVQNRPPLMLSLFRNITAQRRLEEQFRQSQKMEAIGQLAGGVAHDFNNILTVIHGHASLLGMTKLDDSAARSARQITQAAERAAGLTRQLLAFGRRQFIQPKRLDMNKTVGNMSEMLGRLLGEDVALQLNYSPTPAIIEADAGMMEQILLNLAVNARDAMPRGGQLNISIAAVEVDEVHVQRQPEARTGHFVCISKSDTGCGIPPENLPRIFEPFFTTKEVGKGTGLGLATVYGIVKQHQGWIEVESTVGKGTTFRIYFPSIAAAEAEPEKIAAPVAVRGGTETILLVEDEPPVRELVARLLQKHGYKVWQANNGPDALGVWNEHKRDISLLLTDLVMPGNMNGHDLAEKLRYEQPGLKVIFTSGYSADIVGKNFKLEPGLNFLQKPYQPQTLALAVRRCLDCAVN
jgi:PAS domain S-box-containing protein